MHVWVTQIILSGLLERKKRTLSWEVMVLFWKELRENWSTEYDQDTLNEIIK